jgi:hypothetical protein
VNKLHDAGNERTVLTRKAPRPDVRPPGRDLTQRALEAPVMADHPNTTNPLDLITRLFSRAVKWWRARWAWYWEFSDLTDDELRPRLSIFRDNEKRKFTS